MSKTNDASNLSDGTLENHDTIEDTVEHGGRTGGSSGSWLQALAVLGITIIVRNPVAAISGAQGDCEVQSSRSRGHVWLTLYDQRFQPAHQKSLVS